ncbi:hypothetical protein ACFQDG_08350 [Natronoarchaeum mannanilyticum]|uniref:Uncharacterized protein n=1 Tax=Natronoarchaeum mannanilyticum TaxID=926360 RepID=A0AAV3TBH4_9EURY
MSPDTDVYVTKGLLDVLLELADDEDPEAISAALAVTPAGELDWSTTSDGATESDSLIDTAGAADLDPGTSVFTDLFLPQERRSVNAVFGMNMTIPPHQTQGRFLSHPLGRLEVTKEDDLHEVVLVAVPPWDGDAVAAFDRRGRRRKLIVLDAAPPLGQLEDFDEAQSM